MLLRALSVQGEEPDAAASPGPTAAPESEGVLESPLSEAQQVRISIDGGAAASEGADSTSGAPLRDGADLPSPEPSAGAEKHGETPSVCVRGCGVSRRLGGDTVLVVRVGVKHRCRPQVLIRPFRTRVCFRSGLVWSPWALRSASRPLPVARQSPHFQNIVDTHIHTWLAVETLNGLPRALRNLPRAFRRISRRCKAFEGRPSTFQDIKCGARPSGILLLASKAFQDLQKCSETFQGRPRTSMCLPRPSAGFHGRPRTLWRASKDAQSSLGGSFGFPRACQALSEGLSRGLSWASRDLPTASRRVPKGWQGRPKTAQGGSHRRPETLQAVCAGLPTGHRERRGASRRSPPSPDFANSRVRPLRAEIWAISRYFADGG